jgi:ribonuclease HI
MDLQNDDSDVKIYTDGSGMEGKIGAAAALYRGGEVKAKLHYKLGSQKHHMVYEGEAIGAVLGAKLVAEQWGIRSATFCIDNQATIKATQLTKPNPGHYIIDALHENFKALKKKHPSINITIRWMPGHEGIEGNENADEEAKKAITAGSSDMNTLPKMLKRPLPHSKSAIRWAYSEKLKRRAQKLWEMSPRYE